MNSFEKRKQAFVKLGEYLRIFSDEKNKEVNSQTLAQKYFGHSLKEFLSLHQQIEAVIERSDRSNAWFTKEFIMKAIQSLGVSLYADKIEAWLKPYLSVLQLKSSDKRIGVVMAGNLPLAGFHDYLCVLMSGHSLYAKLSHDDAQLLPLFHQMLSLFEPELAAKASFTLDRLSDFDAIIATGSDNTARYFEYYFGKYPHIIRKNRNGVALLDGKESPSDLEELSHDVFMYFGLGCRSVSKLFVPKGYDFKTLFLSFEKYSKLKNHSKYVNNYDYNKSIYLINKIKHFDNGFVLLKEDSNFSSPIAVIYFEYYDDLDVLLKWLHQSEDKIQCLVSNLDLKNIQSFDFGNAQQPELSDYADGVDTLDFLLKL